MNESMKVWYYYNRENRKQKRGDSNADETFKTLSASRLPGTDKRYVLHKARTSLSKGKRTQPWLQFQMAQNFKTVFKSSSAVNADVKASLLLQQWLTISFPTAATKNLCGTRATGRACASVVMTGKRHNLTEHRHMGIRPPAPGGSESQKWLKTKTAPTLRVNFRKISEGGLPTK